MKNYFKQIIKEICNENGISCKFLSKDWIIMLEKDGKTRFISGYKFDLNSHGLGLVLDDKYALYEVLKAKKIPIIEHKIVYNKTNNNNFAIGCNTYKYVEDYFNKNNKNIVIKPNNGSCGKNVFHVTKIDEINIILERIFAKNESISICPFYNIKHEYRVIMLDGEPQISYAKYLPIVKGDGNKTIKELLIDFNYDFFINKLNDSKYDRVLKKEEIFQYNWKFNSTQGAIAEEINDELLASKITDLAKRVCDEINFRFGSIDIIQTTENELLVLEANSGVMMYTNDTEYRIAKNIYKKAIENLFT